MKKAVLIMLSILVVLLIASCAKAKSDAEKYEELDSVKTFITLPTKASPDTVANAYVKLKTQQNIPESMDIAHELLCIYGEHRVSLAYAYELLDAATVKNDSESVMSIGEEIEKMNDESTELLKAYWEERDRHK